MNKDICCLGIDVEASAVEKNAEALVRLADAVKRVEEELESLGRKSFGAIAINMVGDVASISIVPAAGGSQK